MNLNVPIKREKWFYVCHPILWPTGVRGTWGIFDDNKHHIENRPPGIYFVLGKQILTAKYLCAKIWWVLGPILRYISLTYLEIELTCKKLGKKLKNLARFQNFKREYLVTIFIMPERPFHFLSVVAARLQDGPVKVKVPLGHY